MTRLNRRCSQAGLPTDWGAAGSAAPPSLQAEIRCARGELRS